MAIIGDIKAAADGTIGVNNLGVTLAGEDITNDVLKVEQRYSYAHVAADTLIKTGAGFLHTITFSCADAAPIAGTIIFYDSVTEAAPIIYSFAQPDTTYRSPFTVILDVSFTTGLYAGFTTTTDVNVTVSYR